MSRLDLEKCTACRRDSRSVTEQEIAELLPEIPGWNLISEDAIPKVDRLFQFKNFQQALDFTHLVGALAEGEGHHPRLVTEWGRVEVILWTHIIRNLHRNDFVMAAKIDQLYAGLLTVKD